jgi:DNA invertase Pin-like site-specific DNA recombinase
VAEFEKTRIAERMEDGRRGKRAKGGHTGGQPPYGYSVEGAGAQAKLVTNEAEQETINDARRLHAKGRSYRDIATLLMKRGKLARNGKPFASTQVMRMLKSQSKRVGDAL